jgi:hypothetical protein
VQHVIHCKDQASQHDKLLLRLKQDHIQRLKSNTSVEVTLHTYSYQSCLEQQVACLRQHIDHVTPELQLAHQVIPLQGNTRIPLIQRAPGAIRIGRATFKTSARKRTRLEPNGTRMGA